ncbi:hypothetical protein A0J61_09770 [Choanephora cucurbitarum]|uniref:Uncharacterized protein n=1 Tax=Choanephora cucurbitarum TaxID=101091 RepID=A0A1C7MZJ0_9FUNG|nr:hypothetical protein A0J61_09770 [Choanephora cucurbitarum]
MSTLAQPSTGWPVRVDSRFPPSKDILTISCHVLSVHFACSCQFKKLSFSSWACTDCYFGAK